MKNVFNIIIYVLLINCFFTCTGQNHHKISTVKERTTTTKLSIGGPFENREFMYIGMPKEIESIDTSSGWNQIGQKLLITGTIYQLDGKTPASDVILYYYHTDINGLYSTNEPVSNKAQKHGSIRGWVKSDAEGHYSIYTVKPAPYPNSNAPAHIHLSVKEPSLEEYYIDEFVFDDDILLSSKNRKAMKNRGGSGILRVLISGELQIAEHNIILGLHIPNYPKSRTDELTSGKHIGEDISSFTPYHVWGPEQGKKTCPICKYGRFHGILYFVGNHPNWNQIKDWIAFLELESTKRGKFLQTFFVYGNDTKYNPEQLKKKLVQIGEELNVKQVALTFVPSFSDEPSSIHLNNINAEVSNTILIYRNRNIIEKFINLQPTLEHFRLITSKLDATTNEFFKLPEPQQK